MAEAAGVERFKSEAAFARYAGTAPVLNWSGGQTPTGRRLQPMRRGNRQLNTALHRIAVVQIRLPDSPGRAYVQRRVDDGDSSPRPSAHSNAVSREWSTRHSLKTGPGPPRPPHNAHRTPTTSTVDQTAAQIVSRATPPRAALVPRPPENRWHRSGTQQWSPPTISAPPGRRRPIIRRNFGNSLAPRHYQCTPGRAHRTSPGDPHPVADAGGACRTTPTAVASHSTAHCPGPDRIAASRLR